jgi:hypothetical protein
MCQWEPQASELTTTNVLLGGKSGEIAAMRRDQNRTSKQIEKRS